MSRFREHLRRRFCAGAPRLCVVFGAALCLCAVLGALCTVMRFVTVHTSDGASAALFAPAANPRYLLKLAGLDSIPEDVLTLTETGNGFAALSVERAFPVQVTADGKTVQHRTVPCTVAESLAAAHVSLGADDYTEPARDATVTPQTGTITVHRVEYREYDKNDVLPFETQTQYTSLFYRTPKRVLTIQEGVDGYLSGRMRDKIVDGIVTETTVVQYDTYTEPVPEIVKLYKAGAPISEVEAPAGITVENGVPSSYTTKYEMKATGYYSPRGKGSSGLGLYYGTFAVDPTLIPYGTKVYIISQNGKFVYGWAIATDTGAFIHSTRMQVDLFYETYTESAANAVQQVLVYVP
ncbi:MAG: 3D domain-containing protein [Ruthenibacterium sp.]